MNKIVLGFTLAALLTAAPATMWADDAATMPASTATAPAQAAPKDLTDTINKAIALLEAGKNKEVIELLANPADMKGEDMDKIVQQFTPEAGELLKALKSTAGIAPKVIEGEVIYTAKDNGHDLHFNKVNGHWYLR